MGCIRQCAAQISAPLHSATATQENHAHATQGRIPLACFSSPTDTHIEPKGLENTKCGEIEAIVPPRMNTNLGGPLTDRRVK